MEQIDLARIRAALSSTENTTDLDLAEYERQQRERLAQLAQEHEKQNAAFLTAAALERSGMARAVQEKTFANFITNSALQRAMKHKAEAYVANHEGRWFFVGGQSGCVDAITEYFDGYGWKAISQYDGGRVLQYDPNSKQATLVTPKRYIAKPADEMFEIKTERGSISQCLSADHNFAYYTSKGHMAKKPFSEVMRLHAANVQGFYGRIETAFSYDGPGVDLTDNEIRLMCAVIADGSFRQGLRLCSVRIKKERKKERLRELLDGMNFKEYRAKDGFSCFRFYAPRREKTFGAWWYGCNRHQLEIIADEVFRWDGAEDGKGRKRFFSTVKESADFVQFALAATGTRATIRLDIRDGHSPCYNVHAAQGKSTVSMVSTGGSTKAQIERVKPADGMQYCFEVDTGYLVLRRNGRIFVTGNSGKTHICTAIFGGLSARGKRCQYMAWREEYPRFAGLLNTPDYSRELNAAKRVEVLYIDDLFKRSGMDNGMPTDGEIKLAYELLNHRALNYLSTIISTEYTQDQLIAIDEATGGRIAEMAKDYAISISKDRAKNYRLRRC